MLQSYGTIISTRILRDVNGISRGVGFARYTKVTVFQFVFLLLPDWTAVRAVKMLSWHLVEPGYQVK